MQRTYTVLGLPLRVVIDSAELAEMADEVFASRCERDARPVRSVRSRAAVVLPDALVLELKMAAAHERRGPVVPSGRASSRGEFLEVRHGASWGWADRRRGYAIAYIAAADLLDRDGARDSLIDVLGMFLVAGWRRATLHAAAVAFGPTCVLLTGADGAGKSTLAYACLRAGASLISDDITFVEVTPDQLLAWGVPWRMYLTSDSVRLFPELDVAKSVRRPNGETKLEIGVNAVRPGAAQTCMAIDGVLVVQRNGCACARLSSGDPEQIREALMGFRGDPPLDRAAMSDAVERLLAGRTALLDVGADIDGAVRLIRQWSRVG